MTTQRRPPDKVQCLRSGRIFSRDLLEQLHAAEAGATECPACGHATPEGYAACEHFQNVDVDVT